MTADDSDAALEELASGVLRATPARALRVFDRAWPALERHLSTFQNALGVPREISQDCGQATLLRVWKSRTQYRGTTAAEFLAWLYRTCDREHLRLRDSSRRIAGRETALSSDDALPALDPDPRPSEDSPSHVAAANDTRTALDECVAALEPGQRQVVELLYVHDELRERQVAAMTGYSKSRVNQLHQAALASLERCLRRKGEQP